MGSIYAAYIANVIQVPSSDGPHIGVFLNLEARATPEAMEALNALWMGSDEPQRVALLTGESVEVAQAAYAEPVQPSTSTVTIKPGDASPLMAEYPPPLGGELPKPDRTELIVNTAARILMTNAHVQDITHAMTESVVELAADLVREAEKAAAKLRGE